MKTIPAEVLDPARIRTTTVEPGRAGGTVTRQRPCVGQRVGADSEPNTATTFPSGEKNPDPTSVSVAPDRAAAGSRRASLGTDPVDPARRALVVVVVVVAAVLVAVVVVVVVVLVAARGGGEVVVVDGGLEDEEPTAFAVTARPISMPPPTRTAAAIAT